MVPTGTTCLFVTVGVLLCSTTCTEVSRACRSTTSDKPFRSGAICAEGCFRATPSTCKPCPPQCVTCKNSTYCTECIDELWGPACDQNCTNCIRRKCSIHNGSCMFGRKIRSNALTPLHPSVLDTRRYSKCKLLGLTGKHCEIVCALCKNGLCSLGGCTEGCIDGYFSSNNSKSCEKCHDNCASCTSLLNCTSCVSGYHGSSCEYKCNQFCHNATCDKITGECTHGCNNRYYKLKPRRCLICPSWWRCRMNECTASCRKITTQPVCAVKNCKTCKTDNPQFCARCLNGYYVTNNGSCGPCSANWKGLFCEEDLCAEKGYYRDQNKCLSCPPCASCRKAACISSCCKVTTPSVCDIKNCETCRANDTQFCVECFNGSYVTDKGTCEPCSQYCTDRTCDPQNGTCLLGCIEGWNGPHCKESACANNSCGFYRGDQDESGENSMVIGAGIGSAIFVLVVVVIATIIFVSRKKRVQQKQNSPIQTDADAADANIYHNITSSSNNRSVFETTNQNTEMHTLPETYENVDVDNKENAVNTYEALGSRDEHVYSKNSYEALGARDEHAYGTAEEPIYDN